MTYIVIFLLAKIFFHVKEISISIPLRVILLEKGIGIEIFQMSYQHM